jgi:hypothetical protein
MVSEDSDLVVSRFLAVHRLHDLEDSDQTVACQMPAFGHHLDAAGKRFEVSTLRSPEWMLLEEWNDHFQQLYSCSDRVAVQVLSVIVVAVVDQHASDPEKLLQVVETVDAFRALSHRELV